MRRLVVLMLAFAFAYPATAAAQTFTLVQQSGQEQRWTANMDQALSGQATQVAAQWGTPSPVVVQDTTCSSLCGGQYALYLGTHAWLISIGFPASDVNSFEGAHYVPGAYGFVSTDVPFHSGMRQVHSSVTQTALSHEFVEILENPQGGNPEIADPVNRVSYKSGNVSLSDWVFPSYFSGGSGPWDYLGVLTGPK